MKYPTKPFGPIVVMAAAILVCGSAGGKKSTLSADAAASVNGQLIPEKLVQTFLQNDQEAVGAYPNTEAGRKKMAELREAIISEQIDRALIAQEAERRKIAPTKERLEEVESKTILGMGDMEGYTKFLRQNHFSREDYLRYVIRSKLCGDAMAGEFAKEISLSDAEVEKYYAEHKSDADFQWPERVAGAHILIEGRRAILGEQLKLGKKVDAGPELEKAVDAEIQRRAQLAEQIRREATAPGADFGELARKYSEDAGTRNQGGNFGTFAKGTHVLPLDEAFFNLKAGEIGPVVKTDYGFHVIKVLDRKPEGTRTLAEVAPAIRARLGRAVQVKKMRDWVAEAHRQARIEIRRD